MVTKKENKFCHRFFFMSFAPNVRTKPCVLKPFIFISVFFYLYLSKSSVLTVVKICKKEGCFSGQTVSYK